MLRLPPSRQSRFVDSLWIVMLFVIAVKSFASPNRHSTYPGYALTAQGWVSAGELPSMSSYQYLPFFGDLMKPFASLPDRLGACAWAVFGFAIYATGLRSFLSHQMSDFEDDFVRSIVLGVGLLAGFGSLINHQANVLIIGCWLWATVAVRKQSWWLAAFLFTIPAFKIYTLSTAFVFAALYPRQLIGRLIITIASVLILPFLFHPASAVIYRMETLWTYLSAGDHYRIFQYQTIFEAWKYYVGPIEAKWLLPVQAMAGFVVPVVLWKQRRAGLSNHELERNGLFLATTWCVSFGPSIEPHTYLLAAPALGWFLGRSLYGPGQSWWLAAVLIVVIAVCGSPLFSLGKPVRDMISTNKLPFMAITIFNFGLMVVFGQQEVSEPSILSFKAMPPLENQNRVLRKAA